MRLVKQSTRQYFRRYIKLQVDRFCVEPANVFLHQRQPQKVAAGFGRRQYFDHDVAPSAGIKSGIDARTQPIANDDPPGSFVHPVITKKNGIWRSRYQQ